MLHMDMDEPKLSIILVLNYIFFILYYSCPDVTLYSSLVYSSLVPPNHML